VIIFALASATDFLDGHIARKHNLVTTFGKFADPLADKCLVLTSLLILMNNGVARIGNEFLTLVPMWAVAIILLRELIVSGVRLVAAERGDVIAAGWAGKVKTFVTMIAIIVVFLGGIHNVIAVIGLILMYVSVILTIYSGVEYVYNSRKIIFESI
jgi:CDP-diacylglycerol--glycerol-3-phosphate 3-phosphatidyltransferase